ncbi:Uncharacterised protein [Mycobacteroides abscessus]|nr:Uncharacterised protein [Mycobacteroides abscessus]
MSSLAAWKAMLLSKSGAIGRYSLSPAFCRSTTGAIRLSPSTTSSSVITSWRNQLASSWLEMRRVARSSMSATSWISGTLEQPTPWSIQRTT